MEKTYDEICQEGTSAAENRLLEHFKLYGGEVWTIGTGCQHCRKPLEDTSTLKKCSVCHTALFCDRECLKNAWRQHKTECTVIATLQQKANEEINYAETLVNVLNVLGMSSDTKTPSATAVAEAATALQMNGSPLPGWFFPFDYAAESKEKQKELYQAALDLYALVRDEESWTRDKESFPRSSYTFVEAIPHVLSAQTDIVNELLRCNGHLLLFTAWLQQPEPPATQSMPIEDRSFYGVVDSILQITAIRDGIDAFMDSRS